MAFRSLRHTLAALLILLCLATGAVAAVQVRVMPAAATAAVGSTVTVTVETDSITTLGGFQFGFAYNSAELQVVSTTVNTAFDQVITQPDPATTTGSGMIAATVFTNPPLSGTSAALASIVFKILTPVSSSITLSNVILGQVGGTEIPSTSVGGTATGNAVYSVFYDGNGNSGGTVTTDGNNYTQNASVTVLGNSGNLVKSNYAFAGWNMAANGSGTSYAAGSTFNMGTSNVTLYAQWTINSYTVSFNSNGGSAVGSQSVAYNGTATAPTVPTKTGAIFAGWFSDAGLALPFNFTSPIIADTTLYAKWTVSDITGPTLTVSTLADSAITNNATLNVSGTVFDTSGILDLKINTIPVNLTGSSFSYAVSLQPGANSITIVATDKLGNATTESRTIVLDVTAPVLTVSAPADNSKTARSLTTVSGTVNETSTVAVTLNSGTPQSTSLSGADYTTTVTLGAGLNTISIVATDVAGNSSSAVRSVTYINTTPSLAITNPNQDSTTSQNSLMVSGTVTDLLSTVSVTISMNGQTLTPLVTNGTFSQLLTFPAEGTWPIVATATDEVGNSATVTRTIIYAAPHDGVCGVSSGQTLSIAPTTDLCSSGTASSVAGVGPWSWTCGGTNGGKAISCSSLLVPSVDIAAPVVTDFTLPTTAVTLAIPVSSFTATDAVGVTGYTITESAIAPLVTDSGWTNTAPTTITLHTWGYHKLYAYAKDAAGNISAARSASLQIGPADADGVVVPAVSGAPLAVEPQLVDALKSLSFAMKIEIPTPVEILHGDVAPLINGIPHPDGIINLGDTIVILRRVVGL